MLRLHDVGRSTWEPNEAMSNTPLPKFIGDPFPHKDDGFEGLTIQGEHGPILVTSRLSDVPMPAARDTFPAVDEVERLAKLRAAGVTHVTFHETGALASASFEPSFTSASAAPEEEQHDPSTPVKRERRSTGGLVPRGPTST
jgi:hypothetical protein